MTITYKGATNDFPFRLAEIMFNQNELNLINRMEKVLRIKGWNLDIVTNGYAQCEVSGFDEYKEFVINYKQVKHDVKMWTKFGF